jgi:DNA-binding transcriptional MerR regulator
MNYAAIAGPLAKSPDAFRTISEVAVELDVPQHVLRFWESRFGQVKPVKRAGGRRYYRPEDVDLLRGIRTLLYSDGVTIKGVQKLLREQGVRYVAEIGRGETSLYGAAESVAHPSARHYATDDDVVDVIVDDVNDRTDSALATLSRVHAEAEEALNAENRARLEILLDELLHLKTRLVAARAADQ